MTDVRIRRRWQELVREAGKHRGPLSKQDLIDLMDDVDNGYVSKSWAAEFIINCNDTITARRVAVERLAAQLVEAEKYNGWHQQACLENERLRAALLKNQRPEAEKLAGVIAWIKEDPDRLSEARAALQEPRT
jgi:NADP-dependent 3-hydroxy acid dehydrogenase YdfG